MSFIFFIYFYVVCLFSPFPSDIFLLFINVIKERDVVIVNRNVENFHKKLLLSAINVLQKNIYNNLRLITIIVNSQDALSNLQSSRRNMCHFVYWKHYSSNFCNEKACRDTRLIYDCVHRNALENDWIIEFRIRLR